VRLYADCPSCLNEISFWTWDESRAEINKANRGKLNLKCKKCGEENDIFTSEIYAKKNKLLLILSLSIFLIGTPYIIYFFWEKVTSLGHYSALVIGLICTVPFTIFMIINKNEARRVRLFNMG